MTHRINSLTCCSLIGMVLFFSFTVGAASVPQGTTVYNFQGGYTDGTFPDGGLVADQAGNLYGMTRAGGTASACYSSTEPYGCGAVFELAPTGGSWTETLLYSFQGGTDGVTPLGSLVFDSAGNLYGVTAGGGSSACGRLGCGTVFKLAPPLVKGGAWTETVLYTFLGGQDGQDPQGGLALDQSGNLYGVTYYGGGSDNCQGALGCGSVFKLAPPATQGGPWTESIIHRFRSRNDGAFPLGRPVLDAQGNLYSTTLAGGSSGMGTAFKLTRSTSGTSWTETLLHTFTGVGNGDGNGPVGGVVLRNNKLYGTTQSGGTDKNCDNTSLGCGTAFELAPPGQAGGAWIETLILTFEPATTGASPQATFVFDNAGNLYGTDQSDSIDGSNILRLSPPVKQGASWTETTLYTTNCLKTTGCGADYPLLVRNGTVYGTASGGGQSSYGVVFAVVP